MKVLKFGGTSVGTVKSLTCLKAIVDAIDEPAVVVVSALGGITDRLIKTANMAAAADASYLDELAGIVARHHEVIEGVVPDDAKAEVLATCGALLAELADVYLAVKILRHLSERSLSIIVSFGERISSVIVSSVVARGVHFDSLSFMRTERWFSKNIAASEATADGIRATFGDIIRSAENIAICGGFIARDIASGDITNLGRGGSDYTAALIAAALDADVLEIWTDVDGFMTADPRIIPGASVAERMSFVESMQLCSFGAKVIYPPTIYPVFHKNIPIRILNTFNASAPGTLITDCAAVPAGAKGVTSMKATTLISVLARADMDHESLSTRLFNALSNNGVSVLLVGRPQAGGVVFTVAAAEADDAMNALESEFGPELSDGQLNAPVRRDNVSTLALVGEGIREQKGMSDRVFLALAAAGVSVLARGAKGSQTTIAWVVDECDTTAALRAVHAHFFEENTNKPANC